jgi:hypothetical protein
MFEAVGEVEVDGVMLLVFQREGWECAIGLSEEEPWFLVQNRDACLPIVTMREPGEDDLDNFDFTSNEPFGPRVVEVGPSSYTVDAVKEVDFGDGGEWNKYEFAADIGLTYRRLGHDGPGGYGSDVRIELVYAEIGGETYGVAPVTTEGEATRFPFALSAAYPNPSRSTATLTLTLPEPEAVTLAVFDVLGHRVLELDLGVQPMGETRHTIDGAALAPGVYFVRVTTASGHSATRRVVRVE